MHSIISNYNKYKDTYCLYIDTKIKNKIYNKKSEEKIKREKRKQQKTKKHIIKDKICICTGQNHEYQNCMCEETYDYDDYYMYDNAYMYHCGKYIYDYRKNNAHFKYDRRYSRVYYQHYFYEYNIKVNTDFDELFNNLLELNKN